METEWKTVVSKKKSTRVESDTALAVYWNGFDDHGNRLWYIKLEDGTILSHLHKDFVRYAKKFRGENKFLVF